MAHHRRRRRRTSLSVKPLHAPGTAPGTFARPADAQPTVMRVMAYGPDALHEETLTDVGRLPELRSAHPVVWLDVQGLSDIETIRAVGTAFGLHALAVEDVLHTEQRPKTELHKGGAFVVARMLALAEHYDDEQLAVCIGQGFVVTFQERPGDCLEPVRERIRKSGGRVRLTQADYLGYALLDAVVDHYFPVMELFGNRMEELEERVIRSPRYDVAVEIRDVKRDLLMLRRAVWPLREALNALSRDSAADIVAEDVRPYLRDCYDHTVQVVEMVEGYRELAAGLMDLYLSSVSNRMNRIMQVLTVVSTIFIPLTFIAGVYGMNFNPEASPYNMPELGWRWGYVACLGLMALVAGTLLWLFHRAGWLTFGTDDDEDDRSDGQPI